MRLRTTLKIPSVVEIEELVSFGVIFVLATAGRVTDYIEGVIHDRD